LDLFLLTRALFFFLGHVGEPRIIILRNQEKGLEKTKNKVPKKHPRKGKKKEKREYRPKSVVFRVTMLIVVISISVTLLTT
jgi:hypothetical protein